MNLKRVRRQPETTPLSFLRQSNSLIKEKKHVDRHNHLHLKGYGIFKNYYCYHCYNSNSSSCTTTIFIYSHLSCFFS